MKIKVIHSSWNWLPQTQTWMFTQCINVPDGFEQYVVCIDIQNIDQFYMPNICCFKRDVSQTKQIIQRIWRKIRAVFNDRAKLSYLTTTATKITPHIIHSHFGNQGWEDVPLVRKCGARHVVTFYGFDISKLPQQQIWRDRYAELFKSADKFLCEGPHMGRCLQNLGCSADKITVQHLGIELERYPYKARFWRLGETLRVLLAGSFTEKKGIPYAIEALGRLAGNYDMQLTIIGDAPAGCVDCLQEKKRILDAVDRHNLSSRVVYLGYQPHARLLQEAYDHHLFISPSVTAASGDTEGGAPVTIIEMAATGMPVVSTTHCDIPSVLDYGESGWLANERDVDCLVGILEKWLASPGQWKPRLDYARRHIEAEYDAIVQGKKLGMIYRSLL